MVNAQWQSAKNSYSKTPSLLANDASVTVSLTQHTNVHTLIHLFTLSIGLRVIRRSVVYFAPNGCEQRPPNFLTEYAIIDGA